MKRRLLEELVKALTEELENEKEAEMEIEEQTTVEGTAERQINLAELADENGKFVLPSFAGVVIDGKAYVVGTPYGKTICDAVINTAKLNDGVLCLSSIEKALTFLK